MTKARISAGYVRANVPKINSTSDNLDDFYQAVLTVIREATPSDPLSISAVAITQKYISKKLKNFDIIVSNPSLGVALRTLINLKLVDSKMNNISSKAVPPNIYSLTAEGLKIYRQLTAKVSQRAEVNAAKKEQSPSP